MDFIVIGRYENCGTFLGTFFWDEMYDFLKIETKPDWFFTVKIISDFMVIEVDFILRWDP